jgi:hypothetical protein
MDFARCRPAAQETVGHAIATPWKLDARARFALGCAKTCPERLSVAQFEMKLRVLGFAPEPGVARA